MPKCLEKIKEKSNMKITEIIVEAAGFYPDESDFESGPGQFDDDGAMPGEHTPEMELSSNADTKMINSVRTVCDMYKGQGHAQVELLPFLTKVMEIVKKPVNLADLIAINKQSQEIQSMIDSIDEKKVKFKNMSVKNTDPVKEKSDSTVSNMASRAAGRRT